MLEQEVPQDGGDRHPAPSGLRLEGDLALLLIPTPLDANHAVGQVDIFRSKRLQLPMRSPAYIAVAQTA
jgi:hypothetical protein